MSNYTVRITARVLSQFPTSDGYTAETQTQLIALGEAVAALVDPEQFADEQDWSIEEVIENNPYFAAVPKEDPYYEQLRLFCEYCENLAIGDNTPPESGSKTLFAFISQAGTAAPTFDDPPGVNNFGELPVLSRTNIGIYELNFAAVQFPDPNKVQVEIGNPTAGGVLFFGAVTGTKTIVFQSQEVTANVMSGALSAAAADDLYGATWMRVTVFQ